MSNLFSRFVSTVSFALCYNFLEMIQIKERNVIPMFTKFMGEIDVVPVLGTIVPQIFATCLILLCIFHYFNIYDKILKKLDIKKF